MLKTCSTLDEFARDPIGARFCTRYLVFAMPVNGIAIAVAAGRFEPDDLRTLVPLLEALRSFPRHASLWDLSRMDELDPNAFVGLQDFLSKHYEEPLPVERVAVVAPPKGPLRAAAAGMFSFLGAPYPVSAFTNAREGLAWLGREELAPLVEEEGAALVARELDTIVAAWLDANLTDADIDRCATNAGVSRRTLQRRLAERGTSFEILANQARVRAATRRLAGDASLATIAYEVGFSSPERFARVFREITGETPSAARARLRLASKDR